MERSIDGDSQQTLNCALSVDLFEIKDLDRTNPVSDEVAADTAAATEEAGNEKSDRFHSRGTSNFPEEIRGSFLTESLILAQNERWRRG